TQPKEGEDSHVRAPYVRGVSPAFETNVTSIASNIANGQFDVSGRGLLMGVSLAAELGVGVGDHVNLYSPTELKQMKKARTKEEQEAILPDDYEVRGIFDTGYWEYNSSIVIVSLGNAQDMYGLNDSVHDLVVMLHDPLRADRVKEELKQTLGPDFVIKTWL